MARPIPQTIEGDAETRALHIEAPDRGGYIVSTAPEVPINARIVRVGNSRGIRIPKLLLDQAGLEENVELHAEPGRIVIQATKQPRAGWGEAAQRMAARGDDALLDPPVATRFEEEEWEWR